MQKPLYTIVTNGVQVSEYQKYPTKRLEAIKSPDLTLLKGISELPSSTKWWISVGTAIGLYRDGDFIPSDTDIDIGVRAKKGQKHINIPSMTLIRTQEWNGIPIQTAYIDENDCIFDIFYYYEDITPGKLTTVCENGTIEKPDFGIKKLPTKYGELPFLDPIEDYLEDRYGDWQTPRHQKGKYKE